MKKIALIICALSVSGCGLLPMATYDRDQLITEGRKKKIDISSYDIEDVRILSAEWTAKLNGAANTRRNESIAIEEILYYGTLLFAGAQSAIVSKGAGDIPRHLLRLRNVGAGMAAGSTLFSEHYKVKEQQPIFEKAASRMRCATDALSDIVEYHNLWTNEQFLTLVDDTGKPLAPLYDSVPSKTIEYIEKRSLSDLRTALTAISLSSPTKAEIQKVFEDAKVDSDKGGVAVNNNSQEVLQAPTAEKRTYIQANSAVLKIKSNGIANLTDPEIEDRKRKFISAVIAYSSALSACTISNPQ